MTKNRNSNQVGDVRSPSLLATELGLRFASDQAEQIQADPPHSALGERSLAGLAHTIKASGPNKVEPVSCKQVLWFSFFFDGTGNNLDADVGMLKHSNVAKLFRVHKPRDRVGGVYRFYMPGVGTYFAEIGDDGGSALGLGCGAKGQERLDYALKQFDDSLKPHLERARAPSNAIDEINISVFGFSRGAALARAFTHLLLKNRCAQKTNGFTLQNGGWRVRLRFMGLFDTVASVGLPMSTNTTSTVGAAFSSVKYMIKSRLQDYEDTRPEKLAFAEHGKAGADPAPGKYDGHSDWGDMLEISEKVEEVWHFVAAHEVRNSFPLDSVSILRKSKISKPVHFHETVYPGVHSDIGGSYAPGEGARGELASEKLGLIPLRQMYYCALRHGVPMLPESAWEQNNMDDFHIEPSLVEAYNYYLKKIGSALSLGQMINRNMEMYFAWRFRVIRMKMKGDKSESSRIAQDSERFKNEKAKIDREVAALAEREKAAAAALQLLCERRAAQAVNTYPASDMQSATLGPDRDIEEAKQKHRIARNAFLKAKARKDALPNMEEFQAMVDLYDKQLLGDVHAIREVISRRGVFGGTSEIERRGELRPHYRAMISAYENEFEKNRGLNDATIIRFFDSYIHDSLAAFAKDATLPSDPRVVYLGGDEKYEYASLGGRESSNRRETDIA